MQLLSIGAPACKSNLAVLTARAESTSDSPPKRATRDLERLIRAAAAAAAASAAEEDRTARAPASDPLAESRHPQASGQRPGAASPSPRPAAPSRPQPRPTGPAP